MPKCWCNTNLQYVLSFKSSSYKTPDMHASWKATCQAAETHRLVWWFNSSSHMWYQLSVSRAVSIPWQNNICSATQTAPATPQHSACSESSQSYSVATGHRPKQSDWAGATPVCDQTLIERPTTPTQVTVGRNMSVFAEIDSWCTTFYSTSIDTMGVFWTVWPETNYFRFTLPVSDNRK